MHLITHWEGGNLCIVIKYSSERMAEAGLCGWLPGDDGGKSLEVQEDRRKRGGGSVCVGEWGVCCVNRISRPDVLMPKLLKVRFFLFIYLYIFLPRNIALLLKMWPKVFNEGLLSLGLLINGKHLVNELIE